MPQHALSWALSSCQHASLYFCKFLSSRRLQQTEKKSTMCCALPLQKPACFSSKGNIGEVQAPRLWNAGDTNNAPWAVTVELAHTTGSNKFQSAIFCTKYTTSFLQKFIEGGPTRATKSAVRCAARSYLVSKVLDSYKSRTADQKRLQNQRAKSVLSMLVAQQPQLCSMYKRKARISGLLYSVYL